MIATIVNYLFDAICWIIILTIFLSWIPNINWENSFLKFCRNFTELILSPFRNIIPPINGLDLSPIIAIIAVQLIQTGTVSALRALGV